MQKKTNVIGIIVTILILIVVVVFSNSNEGSKERIENTFSKIVMPLQNALVSLKNKIAGNSTFFSDISNLKQENEDLKSQNSKLEQSLRELEMVRAENGMLKEYAKIAEKYSEYTTVPAYIIEKDFSNYSKTIILNVGSEKGIQKHMTVIADSGLVGHVISVTSNTAKVQIITDSSNSTSSTISTTRDSIVVKGMLDESNLLKAMYIPTEAALIVGDSIETSGMGGIYPKGIHIGTISEIIETKNILDRYCLIKTAVDFAKLEAVLIITETT